MYHHDTYVPQRYVVCRGKNKRITNYSQIAMKKYPKPIVNEFREYCGLKYKNSRIIPVYAIHTYSSKTDLLKYDYCYMDKVTDNALSWSASNLFVFMCLRFNPETNQIIMDGKMIDLAIKSTPLASRYDYNGSLKELQWKGYVVCETSEKIMVNPYKSMRSSLCLDKIISKEELHDHFVYLQKKGGVTDLGEGIAIKCMEYSIQKDWVKRLIANKGKMRLIVM